VQDFTPVVADDEKAIQNTKGERWDAKEVHRNNGLAMIPEERDSENSVLTISVCSRGQKA